MTTPSEFPDAAPGAHARMRHRTGSRKLVAGLLSLLLLVLMLAPVAKNWQRKPKDDFPLSHYPMFSRDRQGKASVTYLVGVDREGNRHFISYHRAGTGGFNQVRKQIRKRSRREPQALSRQVAQAVAWRRKEPESLLDSVKIVKGYFAFDRFFAGDEMPRREKERCACPVQRTLTARTVSLPPPI